MDLLIVDLKIRAPHQKLHSIILFIDEPENLGKTIRYDTSQIGIGRHTQHRMSFTAAGLAICKNGSIVSFDYRLNQGECALVINNLLLGIYVVNRIIGEVSAHGALVVRVHDRHLIILLVNFQH